MKYRLVLLLLVAHAGAALAQYKCTAASGAVTFQQTPCFGARTEEKLEVIPNGHPPPASGVRAPPVVAPQAAPASVVRSIDKGMLANYERQHQRDALEQALQSAQDDQAQRAVQRTQAIEAARKQVGDDPSSAAALAEALAAVNSRYNALGMIDDRRIKSAQAALDEWDHAQAAARAAAASSAH